MALMTLQQAELLLPGFQADFPKAFYYLARLLGQDQFELIDSKVVYLMNDAVESFLCFENLTLTGNYDPDYEGPLSAQIDRAEDGRYVLAIHQDENVFTLFFSELTTEVHLYDYSRLGHFWVEGYEYLRQTEYRIAIVRDKWDYLGEEWCTEEELELIKLADFPPINYCCYPAASSRYVVPHTEPWIVSEEAIVLMESLAARVDDASMLRALGQYRRSPSHLQAKKIAWMLHRAKHAALVAELESMVRRGAAGYADRKFSDGLEKEKEMLLCRAEEVCKAVAGKGQQADIVCEEPFATVADGIELGVYVMCRYRKMGNIRSDVIRIEKGGT